MVVSDVHYHVGLQVEWTKAKCRADRWEEEVILLDEEMRRVLEYCDWKADWWKNLAEGVRDVASPALEVGMNAYAAQQSHQEHQIAESFAGKWAVARGNARFLIDRVQGTSSAPSTVLSTADSIIIEVDLDSDDPDYEAMGSDFEE